MLKVQLELDLAILSALGSVETRFGPSDCISFSGVLAILRALGSVGTRFGHSECIRFS